MENQIFFVEMLILPGEAGAEAEAAGTRRVDVMARGGKSIFIGVADVEWLVTYVAEELELGGVSLVPLSASSTSAKAGGGQDFRAQWDFAAVYDPGWTAEILTGALKGTTVKCKLANLDADKWGQRGGSSERGGRSARAA